MTKNRPLIVAVSAFGGTLLLLLILFSPVLLGEAAHKDDDWPHYSNVGQAYGGISAILSGLALCGISMSLLLQQRQVKIERIATEQQAYLDMFRLALDDPDFLDVIAPGAADNQEKRRQLCCNMVMGYWYRHWLTGETSEHDLKHNLARLFGGPTGYRYWERVQATWAKDPSRSRRKFVGIVTNEWRRSKIHLDSAQDPKDGSTLPRGESRTEQ